MKKKLIDPVPDIITGDGLPAHLVARRCAGLHSAEHRQLIWFLQEVSMRTGRSAHHQCNLVQSWPWETPGCAAGGIERLAADLVHLYPDQIGSRTMCRLKKKSGDYDAAEVKALCAEIPVIKAADYPVKGQPVIEMWERDMNLTDAKRRAELYPESYPVKTFLDMVENALKGLPQFLRSLCTDPGVDMDRAGVWYIPGLIGLLHQYKQRFESATRSLMVSTEISRSVHATLDLAMDPKGVGMVVVEGNPREGKSLSAQCWAQQRLGRVRYVQLEAAADEGSFFRLLSRALGTPCNPELKAFELRAYVQEALGGGDLLLLIDEADHLWPRSVRPIKAPARIEWVTTALKNRGIATAMIGTYKFSSCIAVFDKSCSVWASEQFKGRLSEHKLLPSELSDEDLGAIALHKLPSASPGMINLLTALAKMNEGYVATIERAVKKAQFNASQRGVGTVTPDILNEVCEEIAGQLPEKKPALPKATTQTDTCRQSAVPLQPHSRSRATRSSVVQSHVLEAPSNRLNSESLVTG